MSKRVLAVKHSGKIRSFVGHKETPTWTTLPTYLMLGSIVCSKHDMHLLKTHYSLRDGLSLGGIEIGTIASVCFTLLQQDHVELYCPVGCVRYILNVCLSTCDIGSLHGAQPTPEGIGPRSDTAGTLQGFLSLVCLW